jgi:colanic acid/amylovoran biosynthesis glycosyltransferase
MKVGYLTNQYPKVSHTFVRREILALEAAGMSVERYAIRKVSEPLVDEADRSEAAHTRVVLGVGMVRLGLATFLRLLRSPAAFVRALRATIRLGRRSERGLLRHLAYLSEACVLLDWAGRDGVGHLHAQFGTNSATVALLVRVLGGPTFSFTVHGPEEFDKAAQWSLREKIEGAAFVVAISDFGRSQLYRQCSRQNWAKIHVVRCGVDRAFLGGEVVPLPVHRALLSIGRLSEQKGQLLLIEALGRLKREGRALDLTIIGDGELRGEIERAIAESGLAAEVRLVGWADNARVRSALDACSAFILPSFAEGLPVVIMEAFARSRPVLATYVAGIPELVEPGRNGWLIPAGSVEALVLALGQVLDTPNERLAELGRHGRAAVAERHAIESIAPRLAALFGPYVGGKTT